MGSPEPPRPTSWDDLPDDVNDEWKLTYEKVTDDDLPCMKPSHKALEERVNQLEQAARECGHFVRGPHWFDPLSVPMPGCALCEALSATGEDA